MGRWGVGEGWGGGIGGFEGDWGRGEEWER